MNYTENLKLPQWNESDRIRMEDFNDAMQKLDQGYTASSGSYVVGSYTGDGKNQIVHVGFEPSFVIISGMTQEAAGEDGSSFLRYFAMTGPSNMGNLNVRVQIAPAGFNVFAPNNYGMSYPDLNEKGRKYDYIAFR